VIITLHYFFKCLVMYNYLVFQRPFNRPIASVCRRPAVAPASCSCPSRLSLPVPFCATPNSIMSTPQRTPQRKKGSGPPPNYSSNPTTRSSNPRYQPAPTQDDADGIAPDTDAEQQPDKLASVNARVEDVKVSLQRNIELAITRGEKIDEMQEKSEQLAEDASQFQSSARKVRKMFWARYWKMIAIIAVIVIVAIILIVVSAKN